MRRNPIRRWMMLVLLISMDPSAVIQLGLADEDSVVILKKYQYKALALPDPALVLVARAGMTQQELLTYAGEVMVVPAESAGKVAGMMEGWWKEPAVHM